MSCRSPRQATLAAPRAMAEPAAASLRAATSPQYGMGMSPAGFTMNPGAANFGPQMGGMVYMPGGCCAPRTPCAAPAAAALQGRAAA